MRLKKLHLCEYDLKTVLLGKYIDVYKKMFYLHVFNNITDYIACSLSLSVCSLDK